MTDPIRQTALRALDALTFTGVWTALAAGALTWACGAALVAGGGPPQLARACALAAFGTLVVYGIDRLRDVERDAATSPARSDFVSRHRGALFGLVVAGVAGSALAAWRLPAGAWWLCAAVAAAGLLHRRLKDRTRHAAVYVSVAWLAVVAGLPAVLAQTSGLRVGRLLAIALGVGLAIAANALASEWRERRYEARAAVTLRVSRRLAAAGALAPLLVPGLAGLAWVGGCVLLSVALFRPDERYGLVVLDGALLVGALCAGLWLAAV